MSNAESHSVSGCCARDNYMKLPGGNSSELAKCLLVLAGSSLLFAAQADTVAWWHFDEADSGTKAGVSSIAPDEAPALYAKPYIYVNTTAKEAGSADYEASAYAPTYTKPFGGRGIYDPVTDSRRTNSAAMRFATGHQGNGNNSGRAYHRGTLKVETAGDFYSKCTDALTVECFVCTTNNGVGATGAYNGFAPIAGSMCPSKWTSEKWALYMEQDGTLAARCNGTVLYSGNSGEAGSLKVNDGAWHHVALTWDGTTYKLYVDYKQDTFSSGGKPRQKEKRGSIDYNSDGNNATYIGGYGYSNSGGARGFPGLIDELRISSAALAPAQFLQMHPEDEIEDELLRISFDPGEYGTLFSDKIMSDTLAPSDDYQRALLKTGQAGGEVLAEYDTADNAGESVAPGMFDKAADNAASLHFSTNGSAKGYYIQASALSNRLIGGSSTNYTVECFFKTAGQVRDATRKQTLLKWGSDLVYARATLGTRGEGELEFSFRKQGGSHETPRTSEIVADDGTWHHLAMVVDDNRDEVRVYFDYKLAAKVASFVPGLGTGRSLFVGCGYGDSTTEFFDGWIDDLRVTKRALGVDEFLTTHPVGPGSETMPLLTSLLEQNYDFYCASNTHWSVTGEGTARSENAGAAPVFEQVSRGTLLLDGTNGTVSAANDWSARMNRSKIIFPASPFYELDAYTVEFWAKFDGVKIGDEEKDGDALLGGNNHAGILRLMQGGTSTFDWYFFRQAQNPKSFQIAARQPNGSSIAYMSFDIERNVADGKWHHYAISVERNQDNSEATFNVYADYELVDTHTCAGLYDLANGHRLAICQSTSADYNILGNIDAVRFWRGTPDPSQFFGRKKGGMVLVIR